MSDLYQAGYEYGFNGSTQLIDQLPMDLTLAQRMEFDRGRIDGYRAARKTAWLFVAIMLLSTATLIWWMASK